MLGRVVPSAGALTIGLILLLSVLAGPTSLGAAAEDPEAEWPESWPPVLPGPVDLETHHPRYADEAVRAAELGAAEPTAPEPYTPRDRIIALPERTDGTNTGTAVPMDDHQDCLIHPPIKIREDEGLAGFILAKDPILGTPLYRPGSGVTSGTGTAEDPYVIEGWCILADHLLSGSLDRGIDIEDTTAHVTIRDNQVMGFRETGARFANTDHVMVHDNRFVDSDLGIHALGGHGLIVKDNAIVDMDTGIHLDSTAHTELVGNQLEDSFDGIVAQNSEDLLIQANNVTARWTGVLVEDSKRVQIDHNTADASQGIAVIGTDHAGVEANQVHDGDRGITVEAAKDVTIRGNDLQGNQQYGISVWGHTDTLIENNLIKDNDEGLRIEHGEDAVVRANTIKGNRDEGILAMDNHGLVITGNTIQENDEGIVGWDQNDVVISDNLIEGNFRGITTHNTNRLTIDGNTVHNNTWTGIRISDQDDAVITNNLIENGSLYGITINDVNTLSVTANTIRDQRWTPLRVWSSTGVDISSNLLHGNDGGARFYNSAGLLLEDNTLHNNEDGFLAYNVTGAVMRGNDFTGDIDAYGPARAFFYDSPAAVIEDNQLEATPGGHPGSRLAEIGLFLSPGATVRNNTFTSGGLLISGYERGHFDHTIDATNTIAGRPVLYINGEDDAVIPPNTGQVILVDAHRAQIRGLAFEDSLTPVTVVASHDVVVENTTFTRGFYGVFAFESDRLDVSDNAFTGISGAVLFGGEEAAFKGNRVTEGEVGLVLYESHGTLVEHNDLEQGYVGGYLVNSQNSTVRYNEISGNHYGFGFFDYNEVVSTGNTLHDNNIHGNSEGGVYAETQETVDARSNWWGCSDGPGEPGCDTVEGDVDYSDWLAGPVPGAGA